MQDVDQETLSCDIVRYKCLDGPKVSLGQILHQLGTFERLLYLFEDAARTSTNFLKFIHEGDETPTAEGLVLLLAERFIGEGST